jgi:ankyrin repeat protein
MRFALITILLAGCGMRPYPEFTPLADAARAGDVAAVRNLIRQGANPNEPTGGNNWTPLLHAIHTAQIKSVDALLDGGADPNKVAGDGFTPLMMAAGYGYTDIVELLLRRGANPHIAGAGGVRPLDLAVAGVADIDRFTLFQCHEDTIAALRAADPSLSVSPRALMWARAKRCRV